MKLSQGKSARAKRKGRHHDRRRSAASLSLTSLMDIFTILVFFLLVSQADTQQLDDPDIQLPESSAQVMPDDMLTIHVSNREIRVNDRRIVRVEDVMASEESYIPELVEALNAAARRALFAAEGEDREAMIVGDRLIPYALLQKIMMSANQTPYTRISFAVLRRAEEEG